jgi:signal transduction histidine kinase
MKRTLIKISLLIYFIALLAGVYSLIRLASTNTLTSEQPYTLDRTMHAVILFALVSVLLIIIATLLIVVSLVAFNRKKQI